MQDDCAEIGSIRLGSLLRTRAFTGQPRREDWEAAYSRFRTDIGSEVVRHDHFENQRVGSRGKAVADAELDAHRICLIVDHCEKRLSLPAERFEVAQLAVIRVVFKRGCPTFGEIVGHSGSRREIQ